MQRRGLSVVNTAFARLGLQSRRWVGLLLAGAAAAAPAWADGVPATSPAHTVHLSASGYLEVSQDWLVMTLNTTRDGTDPSSVQGQLKSALDAALSVAKAASQPRQLEVRTGQFTLFPRYGSNGKIQGWQGTAELLLEGRDFARIAATAGKIQTLTMGQVAFSLSRETQRQLESDVQAMAIERFKARADEVARSFGFQGYTLREVSISSADMEGGRPQPRPMALQAKMATAADAALPVEAGKSTVNITVSGTVQLR